MKGAYFDVYGRPAFSRKGVAHETLRYDAGGNKIEQINFGVDGEPDPDKDGVARHSVPGSDQVIANHLKALQRRSAFAPRADCRRVAEARVSAPSAGE